MPDPLIRLIRERRPELADRLERLRQESPGRFRQAIADALISRLEEALDRAERSGPDERPEAADGPGPGPGVGGMGHRLGRPPLPPELRGQAQQLQQQHARLEARSRELMSRFREGKERGAPREELAALREELSRAVNEQFEARTQLRQLELRAIEINLERLQRGLEHLRNEMAQRQGRRQAIIERRLNDLLGEGGSDW